MEKCLLKKPTKISFKNADGGGSLSHRRRSTASLEDSAIFIEDIRLGE